MGSLVSEVVFFPAMKISGWNAWRRLLCSWSKNSSYEFKVCRNDVKSTLGVLILMCNVQRLENLPLPRAVLIRVADSFPSRSQLQSDMEPRSSSPLVHVCSTHTLRI